jgi:Protein of unknown function (DUF3467)
MAARKKKEQIATPSPTTATTKLNMVKSIESVPNYYANLASIRTSPHDVQIIHCQTLLVEEGEATVLPQAIVYMSHTHAKRLAGIILQQIEAYETQFGKLPEA